jgi:hypothetical protein
VANTVCRGRPFFEASTRRHKDGDVRKDDFPQVLNRATTGGIARSFFQWRHLRLSWTLELLSALRFRPWLGLPSPVSRQLSGLLRSDSLHSSKPLLKVSYPLDIPGKGGIGQR